MQSYPRKADVYPIFKVHIWPILHPGLLYGLTVPYRSTGGAITGDEVFNDSFYPMRTHVTKQPSISFSHDFGACTYKPTELYKHGVRKRWAAVL